MRFWGGGWVGGAGGWAEGVWQGTGGPGAFAQGGT